MKFADDRSWVVPIEVRKRAWDLMRSAGFDLEGATTCPSGDWRYEYLEDAGAAGVQRYWHNHNFPDMGGLRLLFLGGDVPPEAVEWLAREHGQKLFEELDAGVAAFNDR
jgi:hypothetical protein